MNPLNDNPFEFPDFPPGEVWLAGAGPGDPAHLTLLALHALRQADEIIYDALVDPRVLKLGRPGATLTFAGKRGGRPSAHQGGINELLIERAKAGARVLRLKGGDSFVFGRGGEEAVALTDHGIPFRVIPGVTAGLAAAALAGIPPTTRDVNHAVTLAAGHRKEDGGSANDWEALARAGQPVILYMPIAQLPIITTALQRGGMAPDTPAALLQAVSTPEEKIVETTLNEVLETATRENITAPAILVVGEIVRLRATLRRTMVDWPSK